jgi:hypothetical protein
MEIAAPFISLKVDVLNRAFPTHILYLDGRMETKYSPETTEYLAKIDAMLKDEQEQYIAQWEKGGLR